MLVSTQGKVSVRLVHAKYKHAYIILDMMIKIH